MALPSEMDIIALTSRAIVARENAYAPYSGFTVGAALLTKEGEIFAGCNVENASYSATICAERAAIAAAVVDGYREFLSLAVVGGRDEEITDYCLPCGVCLQVLAEFCEPDFPIILWNGTETRVYTLAELLPNAFQLE